MTGIAYPAPDALPEETRAFLAQGPRLNVFLMWAHSPEVMTQAALLGVAQMTHLELAADKRELVILACSRLFHAPYEWDQHVPIATASGIDKGQLEALAVNYFTSSRFDPAQQALLALVAAVAAAPMVPDRVLHDFRSHFGDRELVEVIGLVGYYFMVGRMTTVLDLESDPPGEPRWFRRPNASTRTLIDGPDGRAEPRAGRAEARWDGRHRGRVFSSRSPGPQLVCFGHSLAPTVTHPSRRSLASSRRRLTSPFGARQRPLKGSVLAGQTRARVLV